MKMNLPVRVGQVWTWKNGSRTVAEVDAEMDLVRWEGDDYTSRLSNCIEMIRDWTNSSKSWSSATAAAANVWTGVTSFDLLTIVPFCVVGQRYEFDGMPCVIKSIDRSQKVLKITGNLPRQYLNDEFSLKAFEEKNVSPAWRYIGEPEEIVEHVNIPGIPIGDLSQTQQDFLDERFSTAALYAERKEFRYKVEYRETPNGMYGPLHSIWHLTLKNGRSLFGGQQWKNFRTGEKFTLASVTLLNNGQDGHVMDTQGVSHPLVKLEHSDYGFLASCFSEQRKVEILERDVCSSQAWEEGDTAGYVAVADYTKSKGEKTMTDTRIKFENVEVAHMSMRTIVNMGITLASLFGLHAEVVEAEGRVYFRTGNDLSEKAEQEVTPDVIQKLFVEAIHKGENHAALDFAIKHKLLVKGTFKVK